MGRNREHAILYADRCVAVNPSDTAPALIALDAKMVIRSSHGERVVNAEDYFMGPAADITRMTVLHPGELLTAIRIPAEWAGAQFYFEKIRDRQVWDFPLVNIASAAKFSGEPAERIIPERIARDVLGFRMIALRAFECAPLKAFRTRDHVSRSHTNLTGRATRTLDRQ